MYKLKCITQKYAWGKKGKDSIVAELASAGDEHFKIDNDKSYAELWMGTHVNGPSEIYDPYLNKYINLHDWLQENPQIAGQIDINGNQNFNGTLPYLFKVLSVATALSVQAHPDMELASNLHEAFPHIYKDPNHKPEMAIALTEFEALCQFRELNEIEHHLKNVPELYNLIGEEAVHQFINNKCASTLKEVFNLFINSDEDILIKQYNLLKNRLENKHSKDLDQIEQLILRLCEQYPVDVGVFCPYLLNYIILQPGQAIFLSANEPHAYISGNCIECMACSDNVVRAGLTPKYIDKDTLCNMLTYTNGKPVIIEGTLIDLCRKLYSPPIYEFEIDVITIKSNSSYTLLGTKSCSIIIIISGNYCTVEIENKKDFIKIKKGEIYLIQSNETIKCTTKSEEIIFYRAHTNDNM